MSSPPLLRSYVGGAWRDGSRGRKRPRPGAYEEAVALANDTPFGLTASLFTRDLSRAHRFADEIQSGVVLVNLDTAGVEFHVPFGGAKESGSGPRERGKAAREFLTEVKTVYIHAP